MATIRKRGARYHVQVRRRGQPQLTKSFGQQMSHVDLYCKLGFSILPIRTGAKTPLVKWEEFQKRKPSPEEIASWFGQHEGPKPNVGIVTGEISDLAVLDIDKAEGEASLSALGEMPKTPTVRTGRGRHFYFRYPGYEVRNFAGRLPGLDLRGDGGYVVAPPSVHPDGSVYEWEISPEDVPFAEMPAWLLDLIRTTGSEPKLSGNAEPVPSGASRSAKAEVDRVLGELAQAKEGTRNDALNRAAFSLGQIAGAGNLDSEWAFDQLARMGVQLGLDEKEAVATVESGLSAGLKEPRESAGEVWEILEDTPDTMDRPIRLIDGRGYGATWLPVGQRNGDPGKSATELVVFDGEGTFYSEREIPDSRTMDDLPFVIDLPHRPMGYKLLCPVGFYRMRRQELPDPADVFSRMCEGIDAFISFENSLADQTAICEFVACWTMGTYAIDAFDVVGYLWPAGERGSGKTVLLNTVSSLAFLGRTMTAGGSFASIRDEAHYGSTIAFDDFENALKMDNDKREPVGEGEWKTRFVNNFAPRLFSSIGTSDPVLGSRTISIPLITTTDHVKMRRSPSRPEHWPHDLRRLIDDLWLTGVVHLARIRECDAEASQVSRR